MMKTGVKIAGSVAVGIILGAGGAVWASQTLSHSQSRPGASPPAVTISSQARDDSPQNFQDPFLRTWREMDRAMDSQRKAMDRLFQSRFVGANSFDGGTNSTSARIDKQKDKMVIQIPVEDPKNTNVKVDVKDGFLTISKHLVRRNQSKDQMRESRRWTSETVNVDPSYDASRLTQVMQGHELVITIPRRLPHGQQTT